MNKSLNAKFGIFLATAALIFAIVALMLLNGSFAWFTNRKDVSANGFSVTVKNNQSLSAELISRPITEINTETGEYTIDNTAISYELPIDDEYNISYSKYQKALAVIITVNATEAITARFELHAESGFDTMIGNDNYVSNCIQISNTEDFVAGADKVVKGGSTQTFVKLNETEKKPGSINLGEYQLPVGESELCFIIEYNDDLLKYIGDGIMAGNFESPLVNYRSDIKFHIYT